MRTAKLILLSAAAAGALTSPVLAEDMSGLVTKVDRLNGTIAIQQIQGGTVGAAGGATREFKVQDAGTLEKLHAGDKVNFTTVDSKGAPTVVNLKKQ